MKKLSVFIAVGCALVSSILADASNAVKLGTSQVTVNMHLMEDAGKGTSANAVVPKEVEKMSVFIETLPVFSLNDEETLSTKLDRNGMSFTGEVPVEFLEQIGGLRFYVDGNLIGGTQILLKQQEPLVFECFISPDGSLVDLQYPKSSTLNLRAWQALAGLFQQGMQFELPRQFMADPAIYDQSWKDLGASISHDIWPKYLSSTIPGGKVPSDLPEWVVNNLKVGFAMDAVLNVVGCAKEAGVNIADPNVETYSFLNEINYSPDVFLINNLVLPVGVFFDRIIDMPGVGIDAIGEVSVEKWEAEIGRILEPAVGKCPKLLLDFLAGASYVKQIENGMPLTNTQLQNIRKGFTDDIGKIVVNKNNEFLAKSR